jgi:hypothetical protein
LGHGVVFLKEDFEVEKGTICLLKKEIGHPCVYMWPISSLRVNGLRKNKLTRYG